MSTGEPVLSLDDVSVHFKDTSLRDQAIPSSVRQLLGWDEPKAVRAVDNVSLDIAENDVVALVGESGCGKTTLGKTAVALQKPTGGTISYRGHDVWDVKKNGGGGDILFEDIRRSLQIIHQDPGSALNPYRTVMSSLSEPLKLWQPELDTADRRERIIGLLERTGLYPPEDYASRYPHQLSGGEQQRVALVRAMLLEPDLIMADEAIGALDVSLRVEVMDLMLELQEEFNTSFIFVSHNLSNARYLTKKAGGKIAVMYLGEIVEIGSPDQIVNDPQHPYTEILAWATPKLDPEIAREAMHEKPPVREIDIPDPENPPSGCRFHTRCPYAREACTEDSPELTPGEGKNRAACFRTDENHPYWNSRPLDDEDEEVTIPES